MHTRYTRMHRIPSWLLCFTLFFALAPRAQASSALRSAPLRSGNSQNGMVRVRLSSLGNPSTLNLTVNGSYTINGKSSRTIPSGSSVTVKFNSSTGALSISYGGTTLDMGTSFKLRRHATSGENGIKIAQGRVPSNLYPGDFYFVAQSGSNGYQLYVIVYVYMEDYLYGVLPYEMGNSSGLEALKAQAVAARTYTMRAMSSSSSRLYDVVDTTSDQVYSGTPSGNANCKAAVDATKGIVAQNGSAFTATYYTASNGGQTESVKNAWGSNSYSYLTIKDDPYDLANSASRKISFTVNKSGAQSNATLSSLLNSKAASVFGAGASVTGVSAVTPHTPKYASPSRLYTKLDFTVSYTQNGVSGSGRLTFDIFNELESPLKMSINSGSNELWSVSETSTTFVVSSRRYGHGIGMSQRGAMYMAQMGYTYDQILAFYFEGCSRVQYTLTRSILSAVVPGQDSQEEVIPEAPADIETAQNGTAVVTLPNANDTLTMRYEPSLYTSTIVQIPNGATVKVYAAAGDDCLVGYGELCGYVTRSWLTITGDIPATTTMTPTRLAAHGAVINTTALNLRSSPSMNSSVYTTIPADTLLPLLEIGEEWSRTQYGLRTGYVSNEYLDIHGGGPSIDDPTITPPPQSSALQAQVTTQKGSLNLRAQASGTAQVLTTIPQNALIFILEQGNTWCKTSYNGYSGYVMTKFLTFLPNTPVATATPTPLPNATPTFTPTQAPANETLYAQVTTAQGSLNLRATANGNSLVLRTIPQYATIEILEKGNTWCKTTYMGYTGFVMTKFLTFLSQQPQPTPTLAPSDQATAAPSILYAQVTTVQGSLNLRASAKNTATVLTTIPQYEIIPIYQRGAVWCQTSYNGYTGYVMTSFLTFGAATTPQATPTPAPATQQPAITPTAASALTAQVTTEKGSLNMRDYPGSSKVLRTIPQFDYVIVLNKGSQWCQVSYAGQTGYVMTKFLTFLSNHPTPTPATQAPVTQVPSQTPPPATQAPTQTPASTVSPTTPPAISNGSQARVDTPTGSLNMRAAASGDATVLRTIPQAEIVIVLEYGAEWSKVVYSGFTGYVMSQYLCPLGNTPKPSATPVITPAPTQAPVGSILCYATVTTQSGSLNLRAEARDYAAVLTTIPQYATIPVFSKGSTWCQVTYGGHTGYVMTKFLTFKTSSSVTALPPTAAPQSPSTDHNAQRDPSLKKLNTMVLSQVKPESGTTLALRMGCSEQANLVAQMPKDDYVIITHVGDLWCTVQYEGKTGYCLRKYLEFELYE